MSLKILLADDSMTAQNMGKKILVDAGYEVVAVSNGAAAVKKIAEHKPDLAILDIYMPGYTGLEVCERVKGTLESSRTPVILTVGKMEPYRPEDGTRVRADGVIVKPFEASDLLAAVEKLAGKIKPAKKVPDDEQTMVIPPPTAADFNDAATYQESKQAATEQTDDSTTHQKFDIPQEMQVAPALGFEELGIEHVNSEVGAAASPEQATVVIDPFAAMPAQPAAALPLTGFAADADEDEPLFALESFEAAPAPLANADAPPALVESFEVEFNSPPQSAEEEVAPLPELEPTSLPQEITVAPVTDPALVDATALATSFPTSFGVENPEDVPVGVIDAQTAEILQGDGIVSADATPAGESSIIESPPQQDDFEARVAAAMAAYDQGPTTTAAPEVPEAEEPFAAWKAEEAPVEASEATLSLEAELAQASGAFPPEPVIANEVCAESVHATEVMVAEHPMVRAAAVGADPVSLSVPLPEPVVDSFRPSVSSHVDTELAAAMANAITEETPAPASSEVEIPVPQVQESHADVQEDRIAQAIQRVLDRFKPQLVSEIARELASEDAERNR